MSKVSGVIEGLFYTTAQERFSIPIEETEFFFEGIQGDKHWGISAMARTKHPEFKEKIKLKNTRQVSIVSVEELDLIANELAIPELKAEWLSANLLVSGIPNLSQLPPGTRFYFQGGVILYNEGQNFPCKTTARIMMEKYPDKEDIYQKFLKAALDKRGLVAWVEYPGKSIVGNSFEIDLPTLWKNLWV